MTCVASSPSMEKHHDLDADADARFLAEQRHPIQSVGLAATLAATPASRACGTGLKTWTKAANRRR